MRGSPLERIASRTPRALSASRPGRTSANASSDKYASISRAPPRVGQFELQAAGRVHERVLGDQPEVAVAGP